MKKILTVLLTIIAVVIFAVVVGCYAFSEKLADSSHNFKTAGSSHALFGFCKES